MTDPAPAPKRGTKAPKAPKAVGRPTALTEKVLEVIAQAKRVGLPDYQAAHFAGVSAASLAEWKGRGELDRMEKRFDSVFARLVEALEKAAADRVAESLLRIRQAGIGGAVLEETIVESKGDDGMTVRTIKRKLAQPQWTADAWLNERTQPQDFGRTVQHVELTGAGGGPVQIDTWAGLAKLAEGSKGTK